MLDAAANNTYHLHHERGSWVERHPQQACRCRYGGKLMGRAAIREG